MKKNLHKKLDKNLNSLKNKLGADESFDVLTRTFEIGRTKAGLVFLDGFVKDSIVFIMRTLMKAKEEEMSVDKMKKLKEKLVPYFEISTAKNQEEVVQAILSGPQVLLLDGLDQALIIDGRTWMSRSPDEPELEKSTRGPADGFVETMLFNVVAIRRRIRDANFRAEVVQVGKRSKNDVALVYIKDIVNPDLPKEIKTKLKEIDIDGLALADKTIEEVITGGTLNPLPLVRYTERPDNVAAHILEGSLAVIVDNSPTVLILPSPFLSQIQTLEIYRKGTVIGTYLSFLRLFAIPISVLLPVIWFLLATNPEIVPEYLSFIGVKESSTIGLGVQFILASLGIDLIRMASIQTPSTLATSLSLIGALILGDFAVKVGLFSPEVILYMAFATLSNFALPGYEVALVLKLCRLLLLLGAIIGNFWGFGVVSVFIFIWFVSTKSFGVYYMWPIIPFDYQALKSYTIRQSVMDLSHRRPKAFKTQDTDRMVKEDDKEKGE
jgi:stage V sporulation protein AF